MAIKNNEAISTLYDLIEVCREDQTGFHSAAENVTDPQLRNLLERLSQRRGQFIGELQGEVRRLGGDPQHTVGVGAALLRGWINIKSAVMGNDERRILEECERAEDSAVHNYEDALRQSLPSNVMSVVQRQYSDIREAHDRLHNLSEKARTAKA